MTTPASPNDQFLIDLAQLGEFLTRIDKWDLSPEKLGTLLIILTDLDSAYDRGDAERIGEAVEGLIGIEPGKRGPLGGLGNQRDPAATPSRQIRVGAGAEMIKRLSTLRAKNEAAQRTAAAENGKEADPA